MTTNYKKTHEILAQEVSMTAMQIVRKKSLMMDLENRRADLVLLLIEVESKISERFQPQPPQEQKKIKPLRKDTNTAEQVIAARIECERLRHDLNTVTQQQIVLVEDIKKLQIELEELHGRERAIEKLISKQCAKQKSDNLKKEQIQIDEFAIQKSSGKSP